MAASASGDARSIRFEPDEKPPHLLSLALGFQYALLSVTAIVIVPAVVVRAAGGGEDYLSWAVFSVLCVCGISTLMQVLTVGRIGAGYILLMATSGAFIAVCVAALRAGGPGLLASLVICSSLIQLLMSQRLSWMRRIFTPTVTGTVIMMIAATVMPIVFEMLETPEGANPTGVQASAIVTLVVFLGVALRGGGAWRLWAPVIGVVIGCMVALYFGLYDVNRITEAPWFGLPIAHWPGIHFGFGPDFWGLLPAFVVVTLVGAVETIGDGVAIQRVSWRKPRAVDHRAVQGAVAADGVGNLLSGFLATVPNTTYSTSVSVVELTGVAARRVGVYIGFILIALAMFPKVLALFIAIPDAVAAAYLLALLAMLFVLGMEIIIQDGIDFRKAIVVGVSFWVGTGFEEQKIFAEYLPTAWMDVLSNGMVSGGLCAIGLTLFIEITNPRPKRMDTSLDIGELPKINEFLANFAKRQKWGPAMLERLLSVSEEAVLVLTERVDADSDEKQRLRVIARRDEKGAELEFLAGGADANLEDVLSNIDMARGAPVEHELSLRLLQHFASSVRHHQYHEVDVLTVHIDYQGETAPD